MRTTKKLTDNKFLNIYEVIDTNNYVKGYQYAERIGVDSIAFICWDRESGEFLINHEYKPPVNEFISGAFGGSLDKNNKNKLDIVIDEVREEAGFKVTEEDVYFVGKCLVSTQMNQYCWLYLVKVNKDKQIERKPENQVEAMAKPIWTNMWRIWGMNDWKAITILSKANSMCIFNKRSQDVKI